MTHTFSELFVATTRVLTCLLFAAWSHTRSTKVLPFISLSGLFGNRLLSSRTGITPRHVSERAFIAVNISLGFTLVILTDLRGSVYRPLASAFECICRSTMRDLRSPWNPWCRRASKTLCFCRPQVLARGVTSGLNTDGAYLTARFD